MGSDNGFRWALLIILVTTMAIGSYYRLKAASSGERISHKEEGYLFAALLRLAGLSLWFGIFGWVAFPSSFVWSTFPLPDGVRWLGVAVGLLAPVMMYWTLSTLGKNLTDTVVTRTEATLVTGGPYRWVRHPFYLTAALIMVSTTLVSANWMIGLSGLVILTLLAIRTPKEERKLLERFGDEYRQYQSRTGRFYPRIG